MSNETEKREHICQQEARLVAIETKLENKKEHLHEVDEDTYHLREKLEAINLNVAELATIMRANQQKKEVEKTNGSLDTMKWLIPLVCSILMFIVNYLT